MKRKIADATVTLDQIDLNQLPPEYRKATNNMTVATMACEQALELTKIQRHQISFILSTRFGEVQDSLQFLKTYRESQTARPILFQNSLHNATLGFVSLRLNLQGPLLTTSSSTLSAKAELDLADGLLELTPYVMICSIDGVPNEWREKYKALWPDIEFDQARCRIYTKS